MAFASINQASVGGGSSNALSIQSDGIFMPRLSTGQRTALALTTSDAGLTVYDFTLNNLFIWNGAAWESIPGSGDAGANGSVQYNDNGIVSGASNFVYTKATSAVSITGDLTVDTNVLKVDTTNNRVGIVTATPSFPLDVSGSGVTGFPIRLISASGTSIRFDTGRDFGGVNRNWIVGCDEIGEGIFGIVPSTALGGSAFTNPVYKVSAAGVHTFLDGAGGTQMTLNSTGLGIGVAPVTGAKLSVAGPIVRNKGTDAIVQNIATTVATLPGEGLYIAYAFANASNPNAFTSYAVILCDSVGSRVIANNGTQITITTSTYALQVTQIFAATMNINWSFVQIG